MLILGIETSCDDTSIAILDIKDEQNIKVLANIVSSQVKIHNEFGGVVPILAAREHERNLPLVLQEALKVSGLNVASMDLIAVTSGPGLIMSLVRGVNFAKDLAQKNNKPILGVNHMAGHIYSNWLKPIGEKSNIKSQKSKIEFPALCLTVSGGHTELVLMYNHEKYELVGRTKDDAAGEAFDKIARLIGLPYPGGPAISEKASEANAASETFHLPRPMYHSKDFDFSFSGLKTAVYYLVRDLKKQAELSPEQVAGIAYEAQEAIVDVLIHKTKKAIEKYKPKSILLAGGVSANKLLRQHFSDLSSKFKVQSSIPPMQYTTDNAAMIAMAGYYQQKLQTPSSKFQEVDADANWEIV